MAKRTNGEGTFGKKKIGKYMYYFNRDINGKYTYARTQKELKEKIENKKNEVFTISQKTTFGEYIQNWLSIKRKTVEPKTYDNYESAIRTRIIRFKEYDLANKQLRQLSPRIFQEYINVLSEKYSRGTILTTWSLVKNCVIDGIRLKEIDRESIVGVKIPIESAVAVKKKEIGFLSKEESEIFYKEATRRCKNGAYFYRNNGIIATIILYTGVRVSELIALKWKNVDLENKKIYIEESASLILNRNRKETDKSNYMSIDKSTKTKSSVRTIPLPQRAIDCFLYFDKKYKNHTENDYACLSSNGKKIEYRNVTSTVKKIIKSTGLNKESFSTHSLRHSYGSILLANGVDIKTVSELLGHKNITTTYNIYIGVLEKDKAKDVERVFDNM